MTTTRSSGGSFHRVLPAMTVGALAFAAIGLGVALPGDDAGTAAKFQSSVSDLPALTTYSYTGSPVTVSVPAGADAVSFVAIGWLGRRRRRARAPRGGHGAQVAGYALVKGTDTITLDVGQQGSDGTSPNTGGGGWGQRQRWRCVGRDGQHHVRLRWGRRRRDDA